MIVDTNHKSHPFSTSLKAFSPQHEAARHLALHAGPVFPLHTPEPSGLCSCGDTGCQDVGKHARTLRGLNAATTDLAQIDRWWRQWPTANIALVTGAASGRFVL